jgi:uncharacterized protein
MRVEAGGVTLSLKVQPRASKNEIGEPLGGELRVKVTAPPVDSAANEAVLRFLSGKLDCPRSAVQLVRGQTSRHKTIAIHGLRPALILGKLLSHE